jgi:hypothetical protein
MDGARRDAVQESPMARRLGEDFMHRILLLAAACACLCTVTARAGETAAGPSTTTEITGPAQAVPGAAALDAARVERTQRAELSARMQAVIDASKKTLAGLQTLIDATTDVGTLLELEARMAQVKQGMQVDLLRVQSTFARENGRAAQANAIDAQIDAILHPKHPAAAGGAR